MRKIILILSLFLIFLITGCENKRPIIFFSTQPITKENAQYITKVLPLKQRIYYMALVPKGLKKGVYRIQFVKKDEKSEFWGYKYQTHYDFKIEEDGKFFITDYIVLHQKGFYFAQFFNLENINKPLALGEFWVK